MPTHTHMHTYPHESDFRKPSTCGPQPGVNSNAHFCSCIPLQVYIHYVNAIMDHCFLHENIKRWLSILLKKISGN